MLDVTLIAALASFTISILIVLTQGWHGKHSLDKDMAGIQKFHKNPVPRIGGIAVMAGIVVSLFFGLVDDAYLSSDAYADGLLLLLLAAMPAFVAGLLEDLTKKVAVKVRLIATFASALLACWLMGAYLPRLDIWGIDYVLGLLPFTAVLVTAFAVAGVANAINIIDGFHGVAGSAVAIMLAGMATLAWQAGDVFVTHLAMIGIGATIGFLLVNYPTGRLFMGDGGAYFLGFWLAEVAVLTVIRNAGINAWQVLAICAYPVIEVVFSMYRRKVIRKVSPGSPDRLHLHTLIYRRVICQHMPRNNDQPWIRNASVACLTATGIGATTFFAVWFGDTVPAALAIVVVESVAYIAVYTRLVRGHWCFNPIVILGLRPAAGSKML